MRTGTLAIAVTMLSLSIAGCVAQAHTPEPVPVDRVECARCRMLVSNETGAAEIVSTRNETRFYDDIGCLAADWQSRGSEATGFVRLPAGGWSDVRTAFYAQPIDARTAMGSGFVAYATAADAQRADRDGRALTWEDVLANAGERQ